MKPWYLSLKYLTKEKPNTAAVTKWLIGLSNDDHSVLKSVENVDFGKLQKVIVDNTFNMNFEEVRYTAKYFIFVKSCLLSCMSLVTTFF